MSKEDTELAPKEWDEMLRRDRDQLSHDPNNAMNHPLGLTDEVRGNLTFMAVIIITFLIGAILWGGWEYLNS